MFLSPASLLLLLLLSLSHRRNSVGDTLGFHLSVLFPSCLFLLPWNIYVGYVGGSVTVTTCPLPFESVWASVKSPHCALKRFIFEPFDNAFVCVVHAELDKNRTHAIHFSLGRLSSCVCTVCARGGHMSLSVCPCLCAVSVYTLAVCCGDEGGVCVGSQPAVFLTLFFRSLDMSGQVHCWWLHISSVVTKIER